MQATFLRPPSQPASGTAIAGGTLQHHFSAKGLKCLVFRPRIDADERKSTAFFTGLWKSGALHHGKRLVNAAYRFRPSRLEQRFLPRVPVLTMLREAR